LKGEKKEDLNELIAKINSSRFAYQFNAETFLENLDSRDEISEELESDQDICNLVPNPKK